MNRKGKASPFPKALASPPASMTQTARGRRGSRLRRYSTTRLRLVSIPMAVIAAHDLHRTYKTTTVKMLITLLIPTSGDAGVLGYDAVKDAREVRKRIGYVFGGERGVYERLSGYDNLRYFAELYGVPPKEIRPRIESLLELVGLKGREQERTEGYSRGMKQRLHIARGLLHD